MKKRYLIMTGICVLALSGCTNPMAMITPEQSNRPKTTTPTIHYEKPTPRKLELYRETMRKVASGISLDPNYRRITLDTPEKKEWFRELTYRLWDRQITRQQFINEGLAKYPTHRYEFEFVTNGFANVCADS